MTKQAQAAIIAAKRVTSWGRFAARRYAEKRGVTARLYRIARQCEIAEQQQDALDRLAGIARRVLTITDEGWELS